MKRIFAFILCICLSLALCGCNTDVGNESSNTSDIEVEEIIIDETQSTDSNNDSATLVGNNNQVTNNNGAINSNNVNGNNTNVNNGADNGNTNSSNNSSNLNTNSNNNANNNNVNNSSNSANTNNNNSSTGNNNTASTKPIEIDYDTVVEVDICDDIIRGYLDATETHRQFFWLENYSGTRYDNQFLELNWNMTGGPYTVSFSEKADFSNAITVQTMSTTIKSSMLVPGKTYYWNVVGAFSPDVVGGGRIKVKDAPVRWIQIDGTGNVRDMGGWKTSSGKTVKYEMLYRGQRLENVTVNGIATIKQLGLKTELDLRYKDQKYQTPGTGMNYEFIESPGQYDNVIKTNGDVFKASYKRVFELLSNESNYPFYAHCNAGADRTGTFAFIVNGVLGVSYEDLTRDFELTSFGSNDTNAKRWRADTGSDSDGQMNSLDLVDKSKTEGNYVAWGKLYKEMMVYGEQNGCKTLESSIEHWLINYIGVPKAQIDSFRKIMLK